MDRGMNNKGALSGITVLDLSRLLQCVCDRINIVEKGKYEAFSHSGIV